MTSIYVMHMSFFALLCISVQGMSNLIVRHNGLFDLFVTGLPKDRL